MIVDDERFSPATTEDWEAILLSSKNKESFQHFVEGTIGEECGVREEVQTMEDVDQSLMGPNLKMKRVEERRPVFCIQEV